MKSKLVKCKTCGAEIGKSADICPKCGEKQNQIKNKIIFIIIRVIMLLIGIGMFIFAWNKLEVSSLFNELFMIDTTAAEDRNYVELDPQQLMSDYLDNEISARQKYEDNYYFFKGKISNIDESLGIYSINIMYDYNNDSSRAIELFCDFDKNEKEEILKVKNGDEVTI